MPLAHKKALWLDAILHILLYVAGTGLLSGAAVAVALGKFMLAVLFVLIATGVFLRIKRGRV